MMLRASAVPDEMPPARSSDSNILRQVPFNALFEPALFVFDLMKSTPLVDSGGPTILMIYLSQEQIGTVPHIRTFLAELCTTARRSPGTTNQGFDRTIPDLPGSTRRKRP
jgi:hypothetical protein